MPVLFVVFFAVLVNFSSSLLAQENQTDNVQIRGPRNTDALAQQTTIGPLHANDTLWRVAERVKPNGNVSLYQVMYALYQKNPEAFLDNNLNHLKPNAVLNVPTLREIKQVDINLARQKSEQDDKVWAQRQQTAKVTAKAAPQPVLTEQSSNRPSSALSESVQWQQELQRKVQEASQQQSDQLTNIRSEFNHSLQQVQALAAENKQLKTSLTSIETELESLKNQLSQEGELQQQLTSLLAQQIQLLQENAAIDAKGNQDFNWQSVFKNPLAWVLAASIPALLVLFSVLLIIKRRGKQTEAVVNAATIADKPDPSYQSPLPPLDNNDDIDESLFELDDSLLEDSFANESFINTDIKTDEFNNIESSMNIDDDLLDFDDELLLGDDSSFADSSFVDNVNDSVNIEENSSENEPFDPDNILSDTDISALLMAEDDEDEDVIELAEDEEIQIDESFTEQEIELADSLSNDLSNQLSDEANISEFEAAENELSVLEQSLAEQSIFEHLKDDSTSASLSDADLIEHALTDDVLDQVIDTNLFTELDAGLNESDDIEVITIDLAEENDSLTEQGRELASALNQEVSEADSLVKAADVEKHSLFALEHSPESSADDITIIDDDAFEFDSTSLDEFAESLAQEQAPDLSTSDDGSVTKVTDASLSVENPSQMLEHYPALDLVDDDLSLDIDTLSTPVLSAEALEQVSDTAAELVEIDPLVEQQFDSLMGELEAIASNDELNDTDHIEFELEGSDITELDPIQNTDFDFNDDDFVEIDKLLASTEQQDTDPERFNQLNVDVGLDEFADVIGNLQAHDVDQDDNGFAAKLDLARAYIEMDDRESAEHILDAILESDASEHVKVEADNLKMKTND